MNASSSLFSFNAHKQNKKDDDKHRGSSSSFAVNEKKKT
jgi:hypothetical protein